MALAVLGIAIGCARPPPAPPPPAPPPPLDVEATAYSVSGTTASGGHTRRGIVAADPAVFPMGSRIRVTGAGSYSGIYTVSDTGPAVKGREIDIFIPDGAEARRFGRRHVQVELLTR
jgi:3D (Asp-Asp-Asp) domain-containing protein